jgi:hypothetical protein
MSKSTGIVFAIGGLSYGNDVLFNGQTPAEGIPVIVATAIAAGLLGLLEHVNQELAVGIAWIGLVTMALIPPAHGNSLVTNLLNATGYGKSKK